jgi:hypothetical protein
MYTITTKEEGMTVTRDVVMVKAKFSDGTVFWKQPFYKSSGTSSGVQGIWFPFLAITQDAYVKGVAVPPEWPNLDKLYTPGGMSREKISPKLRILAYSFLIASYKLLVPVIDDTRQQTIHPKEQIEKFIKALRGEITDKELFDTITTWLYTQDSVLPTDPPLNAKVISGLTTEDYNEINEWIGEDIYINYGRTGKLISSTDLTGSGYGKVLMAAAGAGAGAGASGGRRRRTQKRRRHRRNHRSNRKSKSNHNRRTARRQR